MTLPLDKIAGMPAFSPYYPLPPARYRNTRFHFVYFGANPEAVSRLLPDCFEPTPDGFCAAIGLDVPWCSNYGAFAESLIAVRCTFRDQVGYFAPVVFLNSRSSIPAGREIYGTPKVFADVAVNFDERVMHTQTHLAGASILSIRSTLEHNSDIRDLPTLTPSWRLKVIPRADGRGKDVEQIIDTGNATSDVTIHVCRSGQGVVQFDPQPIYDLSALTPREYFGAHYLEMDYTEGYGEIVHDFLTTDDTIT